MKSLVLTFTSVFSIILSGCFPQQATGKYDAIDGDSVRIDKDGKTYWRDGSNKNAEFQFLGILSLNEEKNDSFLTMPSTHPYLFTQITFDKSLEKLAVDWKHFDRRKVENRSRNYTKTR